MSSKRSMEMQGASDRGIGDGMMDGDAPRQATAAQLAKRRIIQPKGRASGRNSRQASPAVASFTQQQSFQPPPSANGFNFSFGSNNTPSFTGAPTPQINTPSFSFGASQPEASQNGGGNMFGSATKQSSSFTNGAFGSTQPQAQGNGFGGTTSTAFGQGTTTPATTSSFQFGQNTVQNTQSHGFGAAAGTAFGGTNSGTNGDKATPSFNFGAPKAPDAAQSSGGFTFGASQPAQPKENAPSFTFGASQPVQAKESTPSFSFGGTSQQEAPKINAPAFSFGATPSQPKTSNATAAPFSFSAGAQPSPAATTPSLFAATNQEKATDESKKSGLFGSTPTPASATAATPSSNIFSATKSNGLGASLFTIGDGAKPQQPSTPSFSFGAQAAPAGPKDAPNRSSNMFSTAAAATADQPSKQNNMFAAAQSQPATGFSFGQSAPQTTTSDPKPTQLFAGFGRTDAQPSVSNNAEQEDASMTTPEQTPRKAANDNMSAAPFAANGVNLGRSLFDRMGPKAADSSRQPEAQTSAAPTSSHVPATTAPASNETTDLFARISRVESPSTVQPSSAVKPGSSTDHVTPEPSNFAASVMSGSKAIPSEQQSAFDAFRSLNLGLRGHLATQDHNVDWTPIFRYYMWEASRINSESQVPSSSGVIHPAATPKMSSSKVGFAAQTPNMFASARTEEVPATAPVKRKVQGADDDDGSRPPATEKGLKFADPVAYPKLPENASKTARLFESTLGHSTSSGAQSSERAGTPQFGPPDDLVAKVRGDAAKKAEDLKTKNSFNPSTTSIFANKNSSATAPSTFETNKPASIFGSSSSTSTGFTPKLDGGASSSGAVSSTAPVGFVFKPVLSSSTAAAPGSASAAFGAMAKANAEKERQKRKQAEYDSEEENEAEWEARDKKAQEEKRQEIEAAAKKATGFVFKPTSTTTSSSGFTFGSSAATTKAPEVTGTSLFAPKATDADKASGEKAQGAGDHTWKPETPIKFGGSGTTSFTPAAAPPANPFGGLFGASSTTNPDLASKKAAPPALGFNFGLLKGSSVDTSRATTPGVMTDGEASTAAESTADADGEPNDEPRDKQIEDMAALLDEEREENEVLFETAMSKAVKMDERKTENGSEAAWIEKGKGPLYILKNKTTGKARVLLKVPPLGREAMNFAPLKGADYRLATGKNKIVQGMFVDHLARDKDKAGKPSLWTIQVRQPSEATEIARILNENRP